MDSPNVYNSVPLSAFLSLSVCVVCLYGPRCYITHEYVCSILSICLSAVPDEAKYSEIYCTLLTYYLLSLLSTSARERITLSSVFYMLRFRCYLTTNYVCVSFCFFVCLSVWKGNHSHCRPKMTWKQIICINMYSTFRTFCAFSRI